MKYTYKVWVKLEDKSQQVMVKAETMDLALSYVAEEYPGKEVISISKEDIVIL